MERDKSLSRWASIAASYLASSSARGGCESISTEARSGTKFLAYLGHVDRPGSKVMGLRVTRLF